jgi:hypothetical protein
MLQISVLTLALAMAPSATGESGTAGPPANIQSFFHDLSGEWIGTVEQYTNQKKADTKYFHAAIKQMTPDTYAASFEYYRLDRRTGSPVQIGVTDMTNIINADGTAIDTIQGNGDVFIDPKTSRHEEHQLSEVLRMSPSGSLEGKGHGKIKVNGMPLGAGRNGKVSDYTSVWVLKKDALTISERLKVTFRVLIFAKHYDIVYNFQAQRGGDINLMMKKAGTTAVRSP